MSTRQLIIDGITVPVWASTGVQQNYERLESVYQDRTADGSLIVRVLWEGKLRTVIQGRGIAPDGLQDIDTSNSFTIHCVKSLSKNGTGVTFTLPTNRRSDAGSEPFGFAEVNGTLVETSISNVGDDYTLASVSGATGYQVRWFPILTVRARPVTQSFIRGQGFTWSLTAEEP